jgi:hypothetical protein
MRNLNCFGPQPVAHSSTQNGTAACLQEQRQGSLIHVTNTASKYRLKQLANAAVGQADEDAAFTLLKGKVFGAWFARSSCAARFNQHPPVSPLPST